MFSRRIGLVAALTMGAALAAVAGMGPTVAGGQKAVMQQAGRRFEFRRQNLWGGGTAWDSGRRFRRGWSVAHGKRLARKARNQARHRRACRG